MNVKEYDSRLRDAARRLVNISLPSNPTIAELTLARRELAIAMRERRARGESDGADIDRARFEELSLRIARALARKERGKHDE